MKWAVISTWKMSFDGNKTAAELLKNDKKAGDAIIEGVSLVEDEPGYVSVGYGGLPDKDGHVTLDAGYMDGDSLRFGSVGCIEGFRSPVRIARKLSEGEVNNFLVGEGAVLFAEENGFEKRNNLTESTYLRYKEQLKEDNARLESYGGHDTVCFLGKDVSGSLAAAVSTSGLFMKHAGRVGDSPIPGCGFYADSEVGAAAVTGMGEDCIKGHISGKVVCKMVAGKKVQEAVDEVLNKTLLRINDCRRISVIALDKDGNFGVATNKDFAFVYSSDEKKPELYLARHNNGKTEIRTIQPEEWEAD